MLAVNHSIFEQLHAKQYSNQVIVQRPPPSSFPSADFLPCTSTAKHTLHHYISYPRITLPPLPSDSTHESHQNTAEFVHLLIDMHQISGKDVVNPCCALHLFSEPRPTFPFQVVSTVDRKVNTKKGVRATCTRAVDQAQPGRRTLPTDHSFSCFS